MIPAAVRYFKIIVIVVAIAAGWLFLPMSINWYQRYRVHGEEKNLLTLAHPARVLSFRIVDRTGAFLWLIESTSTEELSHITYGVVPPGFTQRIPGNARRPRPFRYSEQITITTVTREHVFVREGTATGPAAFLGEHYEWNNR